MQNVGLTSACPRNSLNFEYHWIPIEYIDYTYSRMFYANLSHHFLLSSELYGIAQQSLRVPPFLK